MCCTSVVIQYAIPQSMKHSNEIAAPQLQPSTRTGAMSTLVDLLHDRASQQPGLTAYTFLEDGEREISSLTYRQLDEKARTIAAYLQSQLAIGDLVLLVYP